jgi:hypothetical protein
LLRFILGAKVQRHHFCVGRKWSEAPDQEALTMLQQLANLWRREDGSSTGLEWVLVAEVLALGSVAAVIAIHRAILGN